MTNPDVGQRAGTGQSSMAEIENYVRTYWARACGCGENELDATFVLACVRMVAGMMGMKDDDGESDG